MIVRENINFERGLDPKTSMAVGKSHLDRKILEETDWAIDVEQHAFLYEIIELIRDYKGYPILVLKNKQQESWPYRAISVRGAFGDYHPTPEKALKQIKSIIDGMLNPLRESLDFERGLKPLKALKIGREAQAESFKNFIEDYLRWNGARVVINDDGTFSYFCFPGQSVRKYILEAIHEYGDGGKYKVNAIDLTSRGDPDGGEEHEYLISPKKSQTLKEDINFERGLEPKKAMGIGLTALEKKILEVTDWHENLEQVLQVADVVKIVHDFRGFPIAIIKLKPENFAVGQELFTGISPVDKTDFVETAEIAEHDAKIDIENYYIRERDLKKAGLK